MFRQTTFLEPTAHARATDPQTSHSAAAELPAEAVEVARKAAEYLTSFYGDFTANELGEFGAGLCGDTGKRYSHETIRKRYTDLLEGKDIVATDSDRRCRYSKRSVTTYRYIGESGEQP